MNNEKNNAESKRESNWRRGRREEKKIDEQLKLRQERERERERIMKQIRRTEMENERLENRDNHNARDDNDTKNFTTEAKGSKAKADDFTTEAKGNKAKADDFTTEAKGGKAKADNLTEAKGSKARADNLATEARGGKARTEENSNKSTEMINEQGGEFPFAMGSEFPHNEVKMIISQRTETGIQTSETGHKMGEQWESHWRNTNWGKRFDYWGAGKQTIPVSLRERRSQQWCRTEDVRSIKEGDMNTDRWRIETPPGIGNEEERAQKGVTHNKPEYNEDNKA